VPKASQALADLVRDLAPEKDVTSAQVALGCRLMQKSWIAPNPRDCQAAQAGGTSAMRVSNSPQTT